MKAMVSGGVENATYLFIAMAHLLVQCVACSDGWSSFTFMSSAPPDMTYIRGFCFRLPPTAQAKGTSTLEALQRAFMLTHLTSITSTI